MLTVMPKDPFSHHYVVVDNQTLVAELRPLRMQDSAEFEVAGQPYRIQYARITGGPLVLESAAGPVAEAVKPTVTSRSLVITFQGQNYLLEPQGVAGRIDQLIYNEKIIGEIRPQSITSRNLVLDVIPGQPQLLLVFIAWLAILRLGKKK